MLDSTLVKMSCVEFQTVIFFFQNPNWDEPVVSFLNNGFPVLIESSHSSSGVFKLVEYNVIGDDEMSQTFLPLSVVMEYVSPLKSQLLEALVFTVTYITSISTEGLYP